MTLKVGSAPGFDGPAHVSRPPGQKKAGENSAGVSET